MKGIRDSEEQILRVSKEFESGRTIAAICRENGLSE